MWEILKQCPDEYIWSESRKVLTWEQLRIDGLEMIGHVHSRHQIHRLSYHTHPTMEFVYIVSGSQNYYIGEQEYTVKGNQVFWTAPYSRHGTGVSLHGRYEFFWFRLIKLPERSFLMLDEQTGEALWQSLLKLPSNLIVPEQNLKELLTDSFYMLGREDKLSQIEGCSLLVQFLCEITNKAIASGAVSEEISAALAYIDAHIGESITLERIAAVSMLSLSRFKTRFRQEVQITPREYINLKKIEKAKELLSTTGLSITEIAMELSFSSGNYFAVIFRQLVGVTPSEYRRLKKC